MLDIVVKKGRDGQVFVAKTIADISSKCAIYGVEVPLRTWPHERVSRTEARDRIDLSKSLRGPSSKPHGKTSGPPRLHQLEEASRSRRLASRFCH
jgi:hypothetical protein